MSATHARILGGIRRAPAAQALLARAPAAGQSLRVGDVVGSSGTALVAALHAAQERASIVVVARETRTAAQAAADLRSWTGGEVPVYPQRETLPYEASDPHVDISGLRVEAVEALLSGRSRLLVTTVRALQERAALPSSLTDVRIELEVGTEVDFAGLVERLDGLGFERVPLVEEVGQYAVRGGLIDVFSFGAPEAVRVEFWGDEIESIRTFDVLDQRSTGDRPDVLLLPPRFPETSAEEGEARRSLLELLPAPSWLIAPDAGGWEEPVRDTWERVERTGREYRSLGREVPPPEALMLRPDAFHTQVARHQCVVLSRDGDGDLTLDARPVPDVNRDMKRLRRLLEEAAERQVRSVLLCDNQGQRDRLEEILSEGGRMPAGTELATGSVAHGFEIGPEDHRIRVFTDHEIFRRSRRLRRSRRFRGSVALESLSQLQPGDYVVHMDHGIGRFRGLEQVEVLGRTMEVLAIEYSGEEVLRVPVYRLDLLERWIGDTEVAKPPAVHRIGGKKWKNLRKRTQAAIETMAAELLELYARREAAAGHAFPADQRWQREMESAFLYDDTPDQRKATVDVKADMESTRPMDRLICGDVGYGKTEIAMRAAFKAVQDGKQVAVLAPTTILVEQHRHTFQERLADFPVRIEALSRFRTAAETASIIEDLAQGKVDIVIGTHRLLSPDIAFANLGLLVVDEEQRFGVKHKERLKELKTSLDVLTLTATPIPRTLHQALSGLRDLTVIATPPRDRMPIITHVLPWSDPILAEALERELDRDGQAYVLHNRVETIHTAAERIQRLVPDASITVAHGQMAPRELDEHMRGFVDGDIDILVCSSIIENGLDVPNANTLIVDGAENFGLAQLYQIRGRVGRSDRRAFCYLVVGENLSEIAEKRLRVLEHYTELGSGYAVAMKDLELRGAGNLLGADQSGFAQQVGMDTYMRMLQQTVRRLQRGDDAQEYPDAEVSLDLPAFLPDDYVADASQKLHLYRRLSGARTTEELSALGEEIRDRYGPLPGPVATLLSQAKLRVLGGALGVERIFVRGREGRINYRAGVVPRLAGLDQPFADRQIGIEIRRAEPLSLALTSDGAEPLLETLTHALAALDQREQNHEASAGVASA